MRTHPKEGGTCGATGDPQASASLRQIVDHYIRNRRARASKELDRFRTAESLPSAVAMATECTDERGKRHSHQRRIPVASLAAMHRKVSALDLLNTGSFGALHAAIREATETIHMIGPLTVYDVATRIGAYLKHAPEQIYLHTGTRDGAKALGLGAGRRSIEKSELPAEFGRLTAAECEDVLCIYKDEIAQAARSRRKNRQF